MAFVYYAFCGGIEWSCRSQVLQDCSMYFVFVMWCWPLTPGWALVRGDEAELGTCLDWCLWIHSVNSTSSFTSPNLHPQTANMKLFPVSSIPSALFPGYCITIIRLLEAIQLISVLTAPNLVTSPPHSSLSACIHRYCKLLHYNFHNQYVNSVSSSVADASDSSIYSMLEDEVGAEPSFELLHGKVSSVVPLCGIIRIIP